MLLWESVGAAILRFYLFLFFTVLASFFDFQGM